MLPKVKPAKPAKDGWSVGVGEDVVDVVGEEAEVVGLRGVMEVRRVGEWELEKAVRSFCREAEGERRREGIARVVGGCVMCGVADCWEAPRVPVGLWASSCVCLSRWCV